MPITLPNNLPAFNVLQSEGVSVMTEDQASRQDIRPLQIGLLNLMPKKIATETQFARLIGATPLQIEFTLIRMSEHHSKNTPVDHMEAFYTSFQDIKHRKFDGRRSSIQNQNKIVACHNYTCCSRMSAASTPATETGFFIASRRKGSPNSWLIIISIKVVLPFA